MIESVADKEWKGMGPDWLQLFNKNLADKILVMSRQGLIRFLESNIDVLRETNKPGRVSYSSVWFVMQEDKVNVAQAVAVLLREQSLRSLKIKVAFDFAFGEEEVYLDYWGCHAHVFNGDPKGSISCEKYLREKECDFLLLRPDHVELMIKSLKENLDDLRVMEKEDIERVEYFRDFCRGHPDYWIAYKFDF